MAVRDIKLRARLSKVCIYLVIFNHLRHYSTRKSAVEIISVPNNQRKFKMLTIFFRRQIGVLQVEHQNDGAILGSVNAQNISKNISILEQRTHLKLGELSIISQIFDFIHRMVS